MPNAAHSLCSVSVDRLLPVSGSLCYFIHLFHLSSSDLGGSHSLGETIPVFPYSPPTPGVGVPFMYSPASLPFCPLDDKSFGGQGLVGKDRDRSEALRTSPRADAEMFNKS